jgi:short subunit dehydrogenase-like uncharacterized protein
VEVTVLGATGFTGRLCAAEALRRGLQVRLAGRRRDALDALAAELGGGTVEVVDATDSPALRRLAERSDVVLTTVGPYERFGRAVLDAAIDGGAGYVDVTGETGFLSWAYGRHDAAAAYGVTAVPGAGFDGVPGELLALLAAAELGATPDRVRVGYLVRNIRPSPGTVQSTLGALGREAAGQDVWQVPFPPPLGSRSALQAPLPEQVAVPRSLPGADASTYMVVPAAAVARTLAPALGAVMRTANATPLGGWLDRAADRLVRPPGPSARARSRAAVLAEVTAGPATAAAWARLKDIYGSTAVIAVSIAERLLAGDGEPGVRTPGQLLGADPGGFLDEVDALWETLGVSASAAKGTHQPRDRSEEE